MREEYIRENRMKNNILYFFIEKINSTNEKIKIDESYIISKKGVMLKTLFYKVDLRDWEIGNEVYFKIREDLEEQDKNRVSWRKIRLEEICGIIGEELYNEWIIGSIL